MTTPHPALLRYSRGEISASEAAELMGGDASVHDVVYQMREASLPLPGMSRPRNEALAAIKRAQELLDRT